MTIAETIQQQITENNVVLYMKGTPDFPQCGFSATTVHILNENNIPFFSVDVLDDDSIRSGIKEFSNWPTIPQLYINGKFVGGCDIIRDMHESGELAALLKREVSS
jgi:monothiol glutaredoxin